MSDKELEEYIKKVEPSFNSHLEKGTIEMSNEYYELLEERMARLINENQELKNQLEGKNNPQIFIDTQDMEERYGEQLYQDYLEEENKKYKNQQQKFIEYMNKTIEELECDDVDDEEMKGYLIQRIDTFKENLSKFKEIFGQQGGQVDNQVGGQV